MRIETCPISGTIERGGDPLEDAQQIKKLLMNAKEESELTMCTGKLFSTEEAIFVR